jgi:hypothetical protein
MRQGRKSCTKRDPGQREIRKKEINANEDQEVVIQYNVGTKRNSAVA